MRLRRSALALFALLFLVASHAAAQAPAKKKKPKKPPKTEQPKKEPEEEEKKEEPASNEQIPQDHPPPKLDTDLKEEGGTNPTTNPWVKSGIAQKSGVSAPKPGEESNNDTTEGPAGKDSAAERKRRNHGWESRPLAIGAFGGYASENLRIGFGARVGYSILDQFYLGAAFTYHLGVSVLNTTISGFYPGFELGYDAHIEGASIRPYGAIGYYFPHFSDSAKQPDGAICGYWGLQLDYQIGPGFVGIDPRILKVFLEGVDISIGVFGTGGVRF